MLGHASKYSLSNSIRSRKMVKDVHQISIIEFLANFAIFPIIELRKAISLLLIPDDDSESKVGVIGSIGDSVSYI